jgi:hypothetical protein
MLTEALGGGTGAGAASGGAAAIGEGIGTR